MRAQRAHDTFHLKAGTHPGFPEWRLVMNVDKRVADRAKVLALRDVGGDEARVKIVNKAFWDSCSHQVKGKVSIWVKPVEK